MNALLAYVLKSGLYLAAFYLVYFLFLSRDTSYSRNRAFILLSMAAAIIMPSFNPVNVSTLHIQGFGTIETGLQAFAAHRSAFELIGEPRQLFLQ